MWPPIHACFGALEHILNTNRNIAISQHGNDKLHPQRNSQNLDDDALQGEANGMWAHLEEVSSGAFHICSRHSHSHSRCKELHSPTALHGTWMDTALDLLLQKSLMVSKAVLSLQAGCIIIYI